MLPTNFQVYCQGSRTLLPNRFQKCQIISVHHNMWNLVCHGLFFLQSLQYVFIAPIMCFGDRQECFCLWILKFSAVIILWFPLTFLLEIYYVHVYGQKHSRGTFLFLWKWHSWFSAVIKLNDSQCTAVIINYQLVLMKLWQHVLRVLSETGCICR